MHPGPEGSLRHGARVEMRCLPTHRFDSLGSNVVRPGGVRVGGASSQRWLTHPGSSLPRLRRRSRCPPRI
eukprot:5768564-Prymnesium_polylepis.1